MYIYSTSPADLIVDFRERGREGEKERNINVTEKHQSVSFCIYPDQRIAPEIFHFE